MQRLAVLTISLVLSAVAYGGEPDTGSTPSSSPALAGLAGRTQRDPRVREYIGPKRVVWQSPTDNAAAIEHPDVLLQGNSGQVPLGAASACTLRNKGRSPAILLDFGKELHGGVQLSVAGSFGNKPVRLRVRFGESVSEAMSDVGGPRGATNDHAVRDQTCLVPWLGTHEIGNTGFRFVRIDLVDPNAFVSLRAVRAIFLYRDLPYIGSFRCNDERLNRIWQTGAYTAHLNMQEYLWDGIKRDRLVWIGDMHPETMTICTVFGNVDVVPASLDFVRDNTPLPNWMNGISSYSMWWVLIQHAWYRHHGDVANLRRQKPYMIALLNQLAKHIDSDNRETLTGERFLDWPTAGHTKAVHAGLQSLMILTFRAGDELCGVLGARETQETCRHAVARLGRHVPDHDNSKQAAALMALADLGDATKLNREVMAVDGAKRLSTFYGYYVLQARAKAGDYQGCLDTIRQFWGGMLDLGATTFWEDFNLDWTVNAAGIDELVPPGKKDIHGDFGNFCYKNLRHSLCHGWASGPTAWLSEHVLGVQVVEPGCKAVKIDPHLGDLRWAEGTFPTPFGVLKVRHEMEADGKVRSTIDAPPGVRVFMPGR
ncbi:MAG: hypothetical protein LLG00_07040 [Planctomycetaceae bacterium]|nr:hypothetical protein [Planctomycetaceae bacterium]